MENARTARRRRAPRTRSTQWQDKRGPNALKAEDGWLSLIGLTG